MRSLVFGAALLSAAAHADPGAMPETMASRRADAFALPQERIMVQREVDRTFWMTMDQPKVRLEHFPEVFAGPDRFRPVPRPQPVAKPPEKPQPSLWQSIRSLFVTDPPDGQTEAPAQKAAPVEDRQLTPEPGAARKPAAQAEPSRAVAPPAPIQPPVAPAAQRPSVPNPIGADPRLLPQPAAAENPVPPAAAPRPVRPANPANYEVIRSRGLTILSNPAPQPAAPPPNAPGGRYLQPGIDLSSSPGWPAIENTPKGSDK